MEVMGCYGMDASTFILPFESQNVCSWHARGKYMTFNFVLLVSLLSQSISPAAMKVHKKVICSELTLYSYIYADIYISDIYYIIKSSNRYDKFLLTTTTATISQVLFLFYFGSNIWIFFPLLRLSTYENLLQFL